MNKIILILPYFGKFPNYFDLWLKTASFNQKIVDFLIVTDANIEVENYPNIKLIKMSFSELKISIKNKKILKENFKLNEPYKLCDYRPLYGLIFSEFIKKYEFWGYCDPDIIWGNLEKFITDKILKKYERIYIHGHLSIYKNTTKINELVLKNKIKSRHYNLDDMIGTNYNCYFDEGKYIQELFEKEKIKTYQTVDFADILYKNKRFRLAQSCDEQNLNQIYKWSNGRLVGIFYEKYGKREKEYLYIHLQKRKMELFDTIKEEFYIVPDIFLTTLEEKNLKNYFRKNNFSEDYKYYKLRVIRILKNIMKGAIKVKIKLKIRNLFL